KRGSKGKKRKDEESPESRPYEAYRMKPIEYKLVELVQGDPSRTIRIRSCMGGLETSMIKVLRENVDMFAWSPLDFRGIDLKLIVHRLNVDLTVRLVQPKKRSFGTEKSRTIRAGGEQTAEGRYVSEIQYTDWLSNVVVVPKAFEKWRMCTGPKDRYPLPRIDIMVDSTTGYEMFSMMDAYQGYHKIYMGNEDRDKTSFITDGGIYCYNVMPFGLKIVGATYQRLVNKMFHDLIDKTMEVYVDDMLVKSKRSDSYLEHLKRRFTIMRSYEKIEAIMKLRSPTMIKEVQNVAGGRDEHVMSRPEVLGRLIKWTVELEEYGIDYQTRSAQKAQILADFMIKLVGEQNQKWMLHVDGSSNLTNGGAGIWIQGPEGVEIEVAARLSFPVTNNEAEYEDLILGLQLAHEVGARKLEVFTGSQLVALQMKGMYETRDRIKTSYREIPKTWMDKFDSCAIQQVPCTENDKENALSKFRAAMPGIKDHKITMIVREKAVMTEGLKVEVVSESKSWKDEIIKYREEGILPDDPIRARRLKFQATRFTICVTPMELIKIACTFNQWGIHIVGPFPPAQAQKKFIILAVEYFSKWVEAEAVAMIMEKETINFIRNNIICSFGTSRILISDNGTQFQEKKITEWCKELKIKQHFIAVANPQANGQNRSH
ncbi:UNVERIFIED_CONTAM: Retrovirus-related Pol polyprotein from transposon, partial [Sesamum indicum]